MDEGTFGEWVRKPGEFIAAGEPIFLLETEKALQEVESVDEGILHILPAGPQPGDTVRVGIVIGYLLGEGEEPPAEVFQNEVVPKDVPAAGLSREDERHPLADGTAADADTDTIPAAHARFVDQPSTKDDRSVAMTELVPASPSVRRLARQLGVDMRSLKGEAAASESDVRRAAAEAARHRSPGGGLRHKIEVEVPRRNARPDLPRISPRAARTAQKLGIDWSRLSGSSHSGRIRECDVIAAGQSAENSGAAVHQASAMRRHIADRLAESQRNTVPVTLTTVVDVAAVIQHRQDQKRQQNGGSGIVPAIHDYVMLATAEALRQFPVLNGCWQEGRIIVPAGIHMGLAVDTEAGLVVPVVRDADRKSLHELAKVTRDLASRAVQRKLLQHEQEGSTFTVSSLGSLGIDGFTPVINAGESAILGIGAIRRIPVCGDDGNLTSSHRMTLSLTFDHQITDGAPAARFLKNIGNLLTNFGD